MSPLFTCRDGRLYWREWERTPEEMERQALAFDALASAGGWFAASARAYAAECRAALRQHQDYHRRAA